MSENFIELASKIIHLRESGVSRRGISRIVGVGESTIRYWESTGKLDVDKPIAGGASKKKHLLRKDLKEVTRKTRFVFTSAQNNTYVHENFLKSLLLYCEKNNAELVVGTFTYDKNGWYREGGVGGDEIWYDPKVRDHILNESCVVSDTLLWCGELNILPTAVTPLSGFKTYCKEKSGIVPHAKLQMESIPTAKFEECRMMYTTGCITLPNYIQKTSGQKAEFHHVIGAVVAEVDEEGTWFVRQLVADSDTGEFYDLDGHYTPEGYTEGCRVEAINWGDLHSEKKDEDLYERSFRAPNSLLDFLKPKYQFAHDTLDFTTRNHHNIKDQYHRYAMQVGSSGMDLVEDDIRKAGEVLGMMERPWCRTIVVESNHDLALMKWLKESDPKYDNVWNAKFYHKCQVAIIDSIIKQEESFSIFKVVMEDMFPSLDVEFLQVDESFVICEGYGGGIECGNHGHIGNNGGKGSLQSFRVLGRRQNIGHGHHAFILDGVYGAGVKGKLDMGYNIGGSNWSHSDIITYQNGKRAIITWKNGKYRD